jgi:hypothetical protein
MRRSLLTRPTVELFSDGEILDVNDLYRRGAFSVPGMWFPFRRLKTFSDHVEINFRDRNRPPQIVLIERTGLHLGGARPWFVCYKCSRRRTKLYVNSIDVACRQCWDLQYASQRQRRKTRLKTRLEKVRGRLWIEGEKIIRPRNMPDRVFKRHLRAIARIEHAIKHGLRCSSIRYQRYRERDVDGRYLAEEPSEQMF